MGGIHIWTARTGRTWAGVSSGQNVPVDCGTWEVLRMGVSWSCAFCPDYQGGLVPWLSAMSCALNIREALCLDYRGGLVPWLSGRSCAFIIREVLCPDYQGGLVPWLLGRPCGSIIREVFQEGYHCTTCLASACCDLWAVWKLILVQTGILCSGSHFTNIGWLWYKQMLFT